MDFPSFLSSLVIASSATGSLLFIILSYVHKEYNSRKIDILMFGSLFFTILTNALLIIAFYQMSYLSNDLTYQIYPLLSYFIAMLFILIAAIYVIISKFGAIPFK
ncbi:Uncharacterised protein [uncultured archaeon]|nr:Uncharacterised protein [uncultured archaeon]